MQPISGIATKKNTDCTSDMIVRIDYQDEQGGLTALRYLAPAYRPGRIHHRTLCSKMNCIVWGVLDWKPLNIVIPSAVACDVS